MDTNNSAEFVHNRKLKHPKLIIFVGVGFVVAVISLVYFLQIFLNQPKKNTELLQILQETDASIVKNKLGNNYKETVLAHGVADLYSDVAIDGFTYDKVELTFDEEGKYTRLFITNQGLDENDYKAFKKDFIELYGEDYTYDPSGSKAHDYVWKEVGDREILLSYNVEDAGPYWLLINLAIK